jgi:CBS domain-containing protein
MLFIAAGVAMMLGAHVPFLGRGLVSGLWIAFIGWFLQSAAAQSTSQVMISELLEGVPVSRLMKHQPVTVAPELSVAQLVDGYLMATAERAFPVVDDGDRLVGIVTMEDVRKLARDVWPAKRVSDIMTAAPEVAVVSASDAASAALQKLAQRDVQQLPVVDGDRLVGLLRRGDVLRWLELQPRGRGRRIAGERHA